MITKIVFENNELSIYFDNKSEPHSKREFVKDSIMRSFMEELEEQIIDGLEHIEQSSN